MAIPIPKAAIELGVSAGTLKRWCREGAPVARKGGKGRGKCTLIDVAAIAAWRRSEGAGDALVALAAELPELLAEAAFNALREAEGPHKRQLAGSLAGAWYLGATVIHDHLRAQGVDIPEISVVPDKIDRLRTIFDGSSSIPESNQLDGN